ncbi:hypothetical protein SEVIR_5G336150v4 [Setaria viridis]
MHSQKARAPRPPRTRAGKSVGWPAGPAPRRHLYLSRHPLVLISPRAYPHGTERPPEPDAKAAERGERPELKAPRGWWVALASRLLLVVLDASRWRSRAPVPSPFFPGALWLAGYRQPGVSFSDVSFWSPARRHDRMVRRVGCSVTGGSSVPSVSEGKW